MVGLCGVIGPDHRGHGKMRADLHWRGDETSTTYTDDRFVVTAVSHSFDDRSQPTWTSSDNIGIWLWGSIWGFRHPTDEYEIATDDPSAYCASLYEEYGMDFLSGLNGNFVGLLYDRTSQEVTLFTDRLGTRPLQYFRTDDSVVFSTNIQSLPNHPAVEADFDLDYLSEYFTLKRTFGVKTPLTGVERLQPSSMTSVSVDGLRMETERYWRPIHQPRDRSPTRVAMDLAETVQQAVHERTDTDTRYGLLLSGGSDSRLMLAALTNTGHSVHAYHVNDWYNREAKRAHQAAQAVDAEFTFLRRDKDYQARVLRSTPRISTFGGYFNQVHAAGFEDTLTDDVDVLFTGHYGDMLFKGNHLPNPTIDLGRLGSFSLPVEQTVSTIDEFVDDRVGDAPAYLTDALQRSVRELYADNVTRRGDRVIDHGVEYDSMREAVLCSRCPLTNGTSHFFYYGTLQMLPSGTLFLDNRLIDLSLTIPIKQLVRGNLIDRAINQLRPELADIPHASTDVPLTEPFALQWVGELATSFKDRHTSSAPTEDHWTHGPWPNHGALIRSHEFIRETLDEHEHTIRRLPFLSWEGVNECYAEHMDGQNKWGALYTLATFLNMPVVQHACADDPVNDSCQQDTQTDLQRM